MSLNISEVVIWPISLVSGSSVFYITSQVVKSDSIINLMIHLRDPDTNLLLYSSKIYSTICPRCRVHGIKDCKHDVFMPRYFDKDRMTMVKLLTKNRDVYQREIRNEYMDSNIQSCFDERVVRVMLDPKHIFMDTSQAAKEVFILIDPSAGGKTSRYAIMSFICATIVTPADPYKRNIFVVCHFKFILIHLFIHS